MRDSRSGASTSSCVSPLAGESLVEVSISLAQPALPGISAVGRCREESKNTLGNASIMLC